MPASTAERTQRAQSVTPRGSDQRATEAPAVLSDNSTSKSRSAYSPGTGDDTDASAHSHEDSGPRHSPANRAGPRRNRGHSREDATVPSSLNYDSSASLSTSATGDNLLTMRRRATNGTTSPGSTSDSGTDCGGVIPSRSAVNTHKHVAMTCATRAASSTNPKWTTLRIRRFEVECGLTRDEAECTTNRQGGQLHAECDTSGDQSRSDPVVATAAEASVLDTTVDRRLSDVDGHTSVARSTKCASPALSIAAPHYHHARRPRIVVIMEDSDRAKPLICHLALLGAHVVVWDAASVMLDTQGPAPSMDTLYFCRASPSARTRGRGWAAAASSRIVEWLEEHGASVWNGSKALRLEVCKWRQTQALARHGIASPHTILVGCHPDGMTNAAKGVLGQCGGVPSIKPRENALESWQAWWVKPTHGGSGTGAARFEDLASVDRMWLKEQDAAKEVFKRAPDNLVVVQKEASRPNRGQRINGHNRFVRTFYRAEFVRGALMYVLKVTAVNTAVSACPCDRRSNSDIVYEIIHKGGSRQRAPFVDTRKWERFLSGCLAYMAEARMIVAAFEFLVTHDTHDIKVIDVNSNTNYGATHEIRANVECGYRVLARALVEEAMLVPR